MLMRSPPRRAGQQAGHPGGAQQLGGLEQWQSHDPRITAVEAFDEDRGAPLHRVAAGLVARLAGFPVSQALGVAERAERHLAGAQAARRCRSRADQCHRREHGVRAPREPPEHRQRRRPRSPACRRSPRRAPRWCRHRAPAARRHGRARRAPWRAPGAARSRRRSPRRAPTRRCWRRRCVCATPICASSSRRRGEAEARHSSGAGGSAISRDGRDGCAVCSARGRAARRAPRAPAHGAG